MGVPTYYKHGKFQNLCLVLAIFQLVFSLMKKVFNEMHRILTLLNSLTIRAQDFYEVIADEGEA